MTVALTDAVEALRAMALDPNVPIESLRHTRREVMRAAAGSTAAELDAAAARLLDALGRVSAINDGSIAITLGALVEEGASPSRVVAPVVAACRRALPLASQFHRALKEADRSSPDAWDAAVARGESVLQGGDYAVPEATAQELAARMPEASSAYEALGDLCLPAIACLTRDRDARALARDDESFARDAMPLRHDAAGWLYQLLVGVADAEWVVLHATERRGYRVRATEINDNWCIAPLIAGALIAGPEGLGDDEGLRGDPPPAELLACLRGESGQERNVYVRGQWEVYTYRALDPSGRLREGTLENKVWNEGIPIDIPALDGTRIIVLGPAIVGRSWRGARSYGALGSDIRHVRTLTEAEVDDWFRRCGRAAAL
jgi:hypothetical protein